MPWSSNATYLCEVRCGDDVVRAIYKPRRGERPLWDFPSGLDHREVAAYELSEALGWDLVPLTILRDGPLGDGLGAAVRRRRLRAALLHALRGRGEPRPAAGDVRLRPRGQQHRPQERPLPPRARRPHPRHRPRPDVPPRVQAPHGDLGVRRRAGARADPRGRRRAGRRRAARPARAACSTPSSATRCAPAPGRWCAPAASRSTRPVAATPGRSSSDGLRPASPSPTARRGSRGKRTTSVAEVDAAHVLAGQPGDELLGRDRPAEQVALRLVAAVAAEQRLGVGALHALGHGPQPEAAAELDERAHDDGVLVVHGHRHHERLVDLQLGDRQAPEVGQRRVAGAEVVHRQPHAERLQAVEHRLRAV